MFGVGGGGEDDCGGDFVVREYLDDYSDLRLDFRSETEVNFLRNLPLWHNINRGTLFLKFHNGAQLLFNICPIRICPSRIERTVQCRTTKW